jgi:hypothetical protein
MQVHYLRFGGNTAGMGNNYRYWACTPLGFYMGYVGICLLTWWDNVLIAFSKFKQSDILVGLLTLEDGTGRLSQSVSKYAL